ncbi:TetR family transcriptional regulator [Marinobacterium nitratireducens]|uniref:TetR family transcriptional regulator n=1 Tax=Marinobacterium nitratireducens TaxID=518897 RepID=A0A917ZBP0_9GAMM|nr:TetR/AcrR family transcriptional regulator [Marinobacterium nitratireducens]GGO80170.1 TetR family transcriptional regulator [Marinobacterium nitratireducens]
MKTRDKILFCGLEQFAEHGIAKVSTNHIADCLDISPGNLYHHFRNKQAILRELYQWFVADFMRFLRADEQQSVASREFWTSLELCFQLVHRYCFIFRDAAFVIQKYPELEPDFREVVRQTDKAGRNFCHLAVSNGVLVVEEEDMHRLATNVHFIFTQWGGYGTMRAASLPNNRERPQESDPYNLKMGFVQILSMFKPYISERDRDEFIEIMHSHR